MIECQKTLTGICFLLLPQYHKTMQTSCGTSMVIFLYFRFPSSHNILNKEDVPIKYRCHRKPTYGNFTIGQEYLCTQQGTHYAILDNEGVLVAMEEWIFSMPFRAPIDL